jgi:hypothetical protein
MKRTLTIAVLVICLLAGPVSAKRVLFYEVGSSPTYTIENGYSEFAEELRKRNYEVASITKGELTKDKLENYDILVVQELNKGLSTTEISAIIWFVLQKGRGLFINGGAGGKANQLTIPFGVTIDGGTLIDTSDQIPTLNKRTSFTVSRFLEHTMSKSIRSGVSKVGFYEGSGLILSGNSACILSGNTDTYSDTGSFSAGSQPCVAATALFGGGLVFTLSDSDILSNTRLSDYNNRNLGLNIIEWLSASTENVSMSNNTQELQILVKQMRLNNLRLEQQVEQLTVEKDDITTKFTQSQMEFMEAQAELTELKEGMVGPFSRGNWAIIALGVCILLGAIMYSKGKGGGGKVKEEDILSELGYELEGSGEGGGSDMDNDLGDLK